MEIEIKTVELAYIEFHLLFDLIKRAGKEDIKKYRALTKIRYADELSEFLHLPIKPLLDYIIRTDSDASLKALQDDLTAALHSFR